MTKISKKARTAGERAALYGDGYPGYKEDMRLKSLTLFGKAVKTALISLGMSHSRLAFEAGLSRQQLANILYGRKPGYAHIQNICAICGLDGGAWLKETERAWTGNNG